MLVIEFFPFSASSILVKYDIIPQRIKVHTSIFIDSWDTSFILNLKGTTLTVICEICCVSWSDLHNSLKFEVYVCDFTCEDYTFRSCCSVEVQSLIGSLRPGFFQIGSFRLIVVTSFEISSIWTSAPMYRN